MKNAANLALVALASALSMGLNACDPKGYDFYSEVIGVCNFEIRPDFYATDQATTLTKECNDAIEAILPFDETWNTAPDGYKTRVIESFQYLIGWKLKLPPEMRVFGVAPNAFPAAIVRIAKSDPNLNKALFNYAVNNVKQLTYEAEPGKDSFGTAKMYGDGNLFILPGFWSTGATLSPDSNFRRASTIMHETRHGDGIYHVDCEQNHPSQGPDDPDKDYYECDPDMSGPHGLSALYYESLLHGGRIPNSYIGEAGYNICDNIKHFTYNHPEELTELLDTTDDCLFVDRDWVVEHEGL